jgi:hypothetical protein
MCFSFIYLFIYDKLDENLPNIHKTKHPKKGDRKIQDGWIQAQAKRRNHQPGWIARGTRSNQVLNSPRTQGAYEIRREEEHLKEHLT